MSKIFTIPSKLVSPAPDIQLEEHYDNNEIQTAKNTQLI